MEQHNAQDSQSRSTWQWDIRGVIASVLWLPELRLSLAQLLGRRQPLVPLLTHLILLKPHPGDGPVILN